MKRQTILITAGPTIEPIDPVRFLSNHSSGKMGYALAQACIKAGHKVILISGPTRLTPPAGCQFISVTTARDMQKAVLEHFKKCTLIFKVAAVADYRVEHVAKHKIKKTRQSLNLKLVKNPDILKKLGQIKKKNQILVGFAAETNQGALYARKKLKEKNLDWIALNVISKKNKGFGSDLNEVTLISSDGKKIKIPQQDKNEVARAILSAILQVKPNPEERFSFKRFNLVSFFDLIKNYKS